MVFLTHYDFLSPAEETNSLPPGPTGLLPLPDMLALACDMRFCSREKTAMGHFEVGAGIVPGGGPMARLPRLIACYASIGRPETQRRIALLLERGLHKAGDAETRLGYHVGQLGK